MSVNLGLVLVLVFIVLVLLRVPLFIALLAPPVLYLLAFDYPILLIANKMVRTLNSFTLLAVPLFIYTGSLMNHSGVSDRIFTFANDAVGHISGGLAHVNVVTSLIFSGMSGSALADVGSIGRVLIHSMNENEYEPSYSAAITGASATIGPIFPPSIPLIIFGVIAQVSVLQLLLAGIVPAFIAVALLMAGTAVLAYTRGFPSGDRQSLDTVSRSLVVAVPAMLAPVVLIGGMLGGFFGPTEAAAVTVLYILLIGAFVYGRPRDVPSFVRDASVEAVRTTAILMIIIPGAALFSFVLSVEQTPEIVASILFTVSTNPIVVLLLVNAFLLVMGMFLEPLSALLVTIPLVVPPLVEIGVDPVHVGVIMVFNLMIGLLTPPLGLSIYLTSDIADAPVHEVIRELVPYYVVLVAALLIVTYVPSLSLWIPRAVIGG